MSNRPTHTSKRLIGIVASARAAVVFGAAPAGAVIASPESSTYVYVGSSWKPQFSTFCDRNFNYVQRMTIGGVSTMVPTDFIYPPGRYTLVRQDLCDGVYIHGLARGDIGHA